MFFCGFAGGVSEITFGGNDGKTVTYAKADGSSTTVHYRFVKEAAAAGMYGEYEMVMAGYLYEAREADAGMFRYLLMLPDTPDTTFHLEFRYAETEADVLRLLEGPCAYWLAAGIPTSALTEEDEELLQRVISLFVVENLAEMANEETEAQRAGLVGTWDCDFSAFPQYGDAQMYIELSANGEGKTYADFTGDGNMALTAEYTFFACDADASDGKDSGTYIAMNPVAETVTPGRYEITAVDGRKALVFTSNEGVLTYFFREAPRFEDVTDESKFYFEPVCWAFRARPQITTGLTDTTFGPDAGCTRGQVVTFLWRAAGCPEPAREKTGFTDLRDGAYYAKAVAWAVEKGITEGISADRFAPDALCTRGQIVTFLWRFAGRETPGSTKTDFADVPERAFYAEAVAWAVENKVTNGMGTDRFAPNAVCTRGQVVTFLYRACGNP